MSDSLKEALALLRAGGFVAYPTETCYGLGADAASPEAVAALAAFKGKGQAPMSLLIAPAWADSLAAELRAGERRLIATFWPGPLTLLVMPPADTPYAHLAAPRLGLRCSSHPGAQALAQAFGRPLTSTSANFHGGGIARDEAEVRALLGPHGVFVLRDEAPPTAACESTVAYLDEREQLVIVRQGAVSEAALRAVLDAP